MFYGITHEMAEMTPGERHEMVEKLAIDWEVTTGTVYRRLKGFREGTLRELSSRIDKGKPRVADEKAMLIYVKAVMGLKSLDPSKPNKQIPNPNKAMSTRRALEIAEKLGAVPKGLLTVRTVNRWAQKFEVTARDICSPTPAVKLVSKHPNQVHVIDFSVCEQYYLREKDGKVKEISWVYKNKPNESKLKIWSFALVDHYSTVKFIKYFLSPGESSDILFRGLVEAWSKSADSQFPFHGAPVYVYGDKGSALKSERIQNFLSALGVKMFRHKPGNPRAKSMVESTFKHFQVDFESELRLCPASSIEELNNRAYNWLVHNNWSMKSEETRSRNSIWQTITPKQLLELPPEDLLRRVAATGEIRTVDKYCSIRFKNEIHGVPPELIGHKVRVWTNMDGRISVQNMETGEMHDTTERKTAEFGTYNAYKKTDIQRNREHALVIAAELKKEITPDILRRKVPNIHAMPRTGTPMEIESDLIHEEETSYVSIYQAKLAIAELAGLNLGDLPEWMRHDIEKALKETLDKTRVHEIARYVSGFVNEMKNAV